MASRRSILKLYPELAPKIQKVKQDVFGEAAHSYKARRTGYQQSKKQLQGVYINQYYDAHPSIDPYARKVSAVSL